MTSLALMFLVFSVSFASASSTLYDWAFFVDGAKFEAMEGDLMPTSGTLDDGGLGTLTWSTSEAGNHTFIAFFDHEIDESENTFFNEFGSSNGTPEPRQFWEIDEPGWGKNDPHGAGDIYWNTLNGFLDKSNGVSQGSEDDVSMALGWEFTLTASEIATISLNLSNVASCPGFCLSQTDPDSNDTIYFTSTLTSQPIPVPSTIILFGSGLAGLFSLTRRKFFLSS